ncbi:chloride channel protein [Microbaculum marinisediminis]|uniref:Chloride channel protein n=1 Tax=Microbaculum marinisediminis TaxID=2931392 RepID=A0AAW5QZS3_9HYPH|nr:chloride channel protein [Microbaculum sp. A6E488]MCT8972637.1 chloride channel protein [Microbaculum sp. A6E488]
MIGLLRRGIGLVGDWIAPNVRVFIGSRQPVVWLTAIVVGVAAAVGAILFRLGIAVFQLPWLGTMSEHVATAARAAPWWMVLLAPAAGGLIVGLLLQYFMPGKRVEVVADVIEARALPSHQLTMRVGLGSAFISALSLGTGASAGREGPVVHLGASLAAALTRLLSLPMAARRTLLGCGVAAAISASFNAPIAGVLFAHEVILGHFAPTAFVPIVIASTVAAVISRTWFGDFPAFVVPHYQVTSYWEVPAFALLGLTCGLVAILFQFGLIGTDWLARRTPMPLILRPVLGGLAVGAIGLAFPEILGVGYEATDLALRHQLPLTIMLSLIVVKTAATAITLASRFGGGIFSPSLYLGAMTGGAFGLIAASAFPDMASSHGLYAILGMGAVAGAVLGAPISTTLIVFELTGGYALSIALLLTVSIANGFNRAIHGRSYFQWQLESRGLFLTEGAHRRIVRNVRVSDFMRPLASGEMPQQIESEETPTLKADDILEVALRRFDETGNPHLPVVSRTEPPMVIGWAHQIDALERFSKELVEANVEEHR